MPTVINECEAECSSNTTEMIKNIIILLGGDITRHKESVLKVNLSGSSDLLDTAQKADCSDKRYTKHHSKLSRSQALKSGWAQGVWETEDPQRGPRRILGHWWGSAAMTPEARYIQTVCSCQMPFYADLLPSPSSVSPLAPRKKENSSDVRESRDPTRPGHVPTANPWQRYRRTSRDKLFQIAWSSAKIVPTVRAQLGTSFCSRTPALLAVTTSTEPADTNSHVMTI